MRIYATDDRGNVTPGLAQVLSDRIRITVPHRGIQAKGLLVTGDIFKNKVGDEGYYLCGSDFETNSAFLTYFSEREDFVYQSQRKLMGAFGLCNQRAAYLGVLCGMEYDVQWHISKEGDTYTFGFYYDLEKIELYEDIVIELLEMPLDATYVEMAKRYRRYMIEEQGCVPLRERIKSQRLLEYVKDSVEIRIRMAWKPAPPTVLEQTLENEPDIHVACTFADVKRFIGELKKSGVEKAQICLVGWNKSGHDGRWPTAFPVEPLLGGEEGLRELIAYAKEAGYLITCHTNSTDCYSISEYFNGGEIGLKDKAGEIVKDRSAWSGGTMYQLCPQRALEIAQELFPKIAELGFAGAHYVDVMSVVPVRTCFDKNHPATARQTAEYWKEIGLLARTYFGGFSSEGSFDHAASYLDYGLYTTFNRKRKEGMDAGVPFWEIAFHGIVMANVGTVTVNYPVKGPEARLLTAALNARPAFYVYSSFMNNGNHWMGQCNLQIDTEPELQKTVEVIKKGYLEYSAASALQSEFIEMYRALGEQIYETVFESGDRILVNYSDREIAVGGVTVGAKNYCHIKKEGRPC